MSDVLVAASSGGGQATCGSGAHVVTDIARCVGADDNASLRTQALSCANRIVHELNMHDWRFLKRTYGAITLVNGTRTYTLPGAFKSPVYARLLDTSARPDADLQYQDDAWMSHYIVDQEATGRPYWYSIRNAFNDALISLYPTPDASTGTNNTLSVEYHARIADLTDDSTDLSAIPPEICRVILAGGKYEILEDRGKEQGRIDRAYDNFLRLKSLAITHDRRISDERARFTIGTARPALGTVYIRVN